MTDQAKSKNNSQAISTWLDYKLTDDNFAAVGFAIQDLSREGWSLMSITKDEAGHYVLWLTRKWAAKLQEKEEEAKP